MREDLGSFYSGKVITGKNSLTGLGGWQTSLGNSVMSKAAMTRSEGL